MRLLCLPCGGLWWPCVCPVVACGVTGPEGAITGPEGAITGPCGVGYLGWAGGEYPPPGWGVFSAAGVIAVIAVIAVISAI